MGNAPEWHIIGQSVRGASHVRSGLPNQDAIRWLPASRVGPPLILTVSDGHGSAKSFRSDVGSRLAAEETAWLIQDLLDGQPDPNNLSAIKRTAEERLPQEVARRWQTAVDSHLKKAAFTKEEFETLEKKRGSKAVRDVKANPRLAYGSTLLCALITSSFIMYLQLGDGDILTVSEDGHVSRPLPSDARLFANQTTSLCMEKAWREIRFHFQTLFGSPPAMILLSSDGYANSFVDDRAFFKVGSDILDILREDGPDTVAESLESWLNDASGSGSGDDITLGILFRTNILSPTKKPAGKSAEPVKKQLSAPKKPTAPSEEPDPQAAPTTPAEPPPTTKPASAAPEKKPVEGNEDEGPAANDEAKSHPGKKIDRIKSEGPREPAKKLPGMFEDD